MNPENFLFHLFGKINSVHRILLFILFITTNSLIYSQQPATCVTDGGLAGDTGLKTWCWEDLTLPTGITDTFSNSELALNVECDINDIYISDGRIHFDIDPVSPVATCGAEAYNKRSEIRTMPWPVQNPLGTEEWIGFNYKFEDDYVIDPTNNFLFYQHHQGVDGSPPWDLSVFREGQRFGNPAGEIFVVNNSNDNAPTYYDRTATGVVPQPGQSIDVVIHVVHNTGTSGLLQIWIDGVSVYNKQTVATVWNDKAWGGNAKVGLYMYSWTNGTAVTASANAGVTSIHTSMGALRIITRLPSDPDYLQDDYVTVFPSVESEEVNAASVTVTPSTYELANGSTTQLTATISPVNATDQTGVWSSSDEFIATVDNNGVVTSISEGEAIITFTANDGGFSDSATITVTNVPIGVESISLSPETLDLNINGTDVIVASILPANASDQTGVWTSSDPGLATVDQQGLVQPIAVGQTTITFTTNDGGFSDTSIVTINNDHFGDYEFYNADTDVLIQVVEGGESFDLDNIGENVNFRVIPLGGDANPEVESVGIQWNGIETGTYGENAPLYAGMTGHIGNDYEPYTVSEGTYNFTVTYYSGDNQSGNIVAADSFELSFTRAAQANQVNAGDDSTICEGDTAALAASAADTYLWSTGETSETIAVTPNITTTYTVTGTHSDGSTTEDSVTVTVNETPTVDAGVDQTICEGESVVLTATVTNGSISWSNGATTASITVNPADTATYSVTVNNNGCVATDSVTVTVNSLPIADAGNDVTIVNGASATLTASGGATYVWSTGETTSSIVVNPTVDTTYSVSVTSAEGCSSGDSVNVIVLEAIVAYAGEDVSICSGESTTLAASGGFNYLWSTGETTQSISVNPTTTTNYSVVVSNQDQSVSDTDSVTVTVFDLPIADAGNDVTIINGESTTLTASGGGTYNWSTGETTSSIVVNPTIDTTYSVIVSNAGCTSEDSINVIVVEAIVANAGEDVSICFGENATLTASGGFNYLWSTGETAQSISVNPTETTSYSVTVSNQDQSASDTDSVTVTVFDQPIAEVSNDVTIAIGQSATLFATGGDTYEWSTGETGNSITVTPTTDTTYSVIVYNAGGCSDEDTVTIFVIEEVIANAGEDLAMCEGDNVTLTASGGDTYLWSTGETAESITVSPLNTTNYTVVVSDQYTSDTDDVQVTVNPLPVVSAGDDVTINAGESVTLYGSGGNTYLWSTGETNANISVSPTETTTYTITTTINGCSDSDEVTVTVINMVNASAGEDQESCPGIDVILSASGGDSYVWSTGETTQQITVNPEETTSYTVVATTALGSGSDDVTVNVDTCLLDNEPAEILGFSFKAFPNPNNGDLNVKITGLHTSGVVMVTDILGNNLKYIELELNGGETRNLKVDLTSVARGLYLVTLYSDNRTVTKKIVRD